MSTLPPPPPPRPPLPSTKDPETVLAYFETTLAGLRAGVVDLESSPSFLMLSTAAMTGRTHDKYKDLPKAAETLWPLLITIGNRLDECRSITESDAGFKSSRRKQLAAALAKPLHSIDHPDFTDSKLSINQGFNEMRARYAKLRAAAAEIETLWLSVLPRVDAAKLTLSNLAIEAQSLGISEPLIGRAKHLADDLSERLVSDPLSVHPKDGANLDSQVSAAARQIAKLQTGRADLATDLAQAKELLASLRVLHSRAGANRSEAEDKVLNATGLVRVPSTAIFDHPAKGLSAQLSKVVAASENWSSQRTLLDVWLASAERLRVQLEAAEASNGAPIEARNELRGRLKAYESKMATIGQAEQMDLVAMLDAATDELYTTPTDLANANSIITALADRLRSAD